ncbi:NfeD family protein [Paenibacillus eucommiae]|uniref:Membrane protein implicated in regulation of membrane protease activity n=1 Tax=Paenibacillus eucommiae TaxID=1355755 RepID=A0ABS4IPC4_9BACL|nr:NfeD family protein [Paenibacillus eucommiae]MBP1989409.1 membrane protein implicated in regulation of membrane protease activity [Paenibacillus eucommiae]
MELWAIWLIIGCVLLVAEMLTLTFYMLWLGVGALIAFAIALIFPDSFLLQVLFGCIAALLLTIFSKPLTRRIRKAEGFKDAIDDLVGKQGIVVQEISEGKYGVVKVGNETWSAFSNEHLFINDSVIVVSRGNTTLEVQKWGGVI